MSFAMAGPLQEAIFQHLAADPGLQALVGAAIYDEVPPGLPPGTYVVLGDEQTRDASDRDGAAALHELTISVVSDAAGFRTAKAVAAAVSDALEGASLVLSRGRLVGMWFVKARARRAGQGDVRRIDMRFRARTEDNVI